jgi:hypothetical protein
MQFRNIYFQYFNKNTKLGKFFAGNKHRNLTKEKRTASSKTMEEHKKIIARQQLKFSKISFQYF